jgi:hypothetical protein
MKTLWIVVIAIVMAPALAFAQTERAYVSGIGGFAMTPDTTSGDVSAEAGVRVAPHLSLFADVGHFHNLQPSDVQDNVDLTTQASADTGLSVIGTGRVPAVYSIGGVRYQPAMHGRVAPYLLGGVGVAHLKPTARFTYSSGALPDGSTPASKCRSRATGPSTPTIASRASRPTPRSTRRVRRSASAIVSERSRQVNPPRGL